MASTKVSPASDSSGPSSYSETTRAHYDGHSHSEMMTAARAPDKAQRLRFRVARPSPDSVSDTLLEGERARLGAFLTQNPPSRVKNSDGSKWIYIVHEQEASDDDRDDDEREEWEVTEGQKESMLRDWNSCGEVREMSNVYELAKKYSVLSGKWMLFVTSDKVDEVWGMISRAVMEKQLGPHVTGAKVSPVADDSGVFSGKQYLICVYNHDYLEKCQIEESHRGLRSFGILHHMDYKPDIFTLLKIHNGNPWGLQSTLYKSGVGKRSGRSSIKDTVDWRTQRRRAGPAPLCRDGLECRFLRENTCHSGHPGRGVGQLEK